MKKRVRLSRRARADLRSIGGYTIENWGAPQSDAYLGEINATFERLGTGRLRGRSVAEVGPDLMKTRVGSHVIFYRMSDAAILVVRILHERMDPLRHLL
ncbi:type II toxin-antitoxin system RelE/ParE family toxin [Salinarimonas rosea]|uniref:type II toxin-antitoxin system RelE/ParE family toxin n=1 Tax=Salinarimonas rosea TaxID=552063 RepID=UPI00048E30C1|nr:type II toxin-antitoxin system RelE/ParE family toxin [Salinarimonas rosea]